MRHVFRTVNERRHVKSSHRFNFSPDFTRVFEHDHDLQPQPLMALHEPLLLCADPPVESHFNAPIIRLNGFALLDTLSGYVPLKMLIEKQCNILAQAVLITLDYPSVRLHNWHPDQ